MHLRKIAQALLAAVAAGAMLGSALILQSASGITISTDLSNVDTDHAVSLTVHKYLGPAKNTTKSNSAARNNGDMLTQTNDLGDPLSGVEFDIYHVKDVDLTTNAGWQEAAALKAHPISFSEIQSMKLHVSSSNSKYYTLEHKKSGKTSSDGSIKFKSQEASSSSSVSSNSGSTEVTLEKGDKAGLYLVVENLKNSNNIKKNGPQSVPQNTVTPSEPFLVTLPLTNPQSHDKWMYDVHVYPKNQSDTLTKMVDDSKAYSPTATEHTIDYVLAGDITDTGDTNGDKKVDHDDLGYYMLEDTLDITKFNVAMAKLELKYGASFTSSAQKLDVHDYVRHIDTATGKIAVALTSAGLDKVAMANNTTPSTKVFLKISVPLKNTAQLGDTPLENIAYLVPNGKWFTNNGGSKQTPPTDSSSGNNPGDFPSSTPPTIPKGPSDPEHPGTTGTPGIPSNKVTSKYGTIVIKKTDDTYSKMLDGAEFKLYHAIPTSQSTNLVEASETEQTCKGAIELTNFVADAMSVSGQMGLYEFKNIRLSTEFTHINPDNGMEVSHSSGNKHEKYCIVEKKAPVGYELLAEPIEFELKTGASPVTPKTVADALNGSKKMSDNGVLIANLPSNLGNHLPLTGASGVIVAAVAGIALLGGGLILWLCATAAPKRSSGALAARC